MEDGFPLFDSNNETERQEQKLREYYDSFSANARKRLLAKTVVRPTSVYDILYPQTRVALLAKNIPINNDLEENAKIIRDKLIAKIVIEETDLEKISADFRNSLLARAKIQDDRNNLSNSSDAYRKTNLAKNSIKDTDLEKDSDFARIDNITKNKPNLSLRGDIESNSGFYKQNALSKNTSKEQDLLRDSNDFRIDDIHKNTSNKSDLERDSDAFRNSNTSKNIDGNKSVQEIADLQREQLLAKNAAKASDIESVSAQFRVDDISKNIPKGQDLLRDSEDIRNQFRKNDINKNTINNSNIESDSNTFRKNNLSNNKPKTSDIESSSETFRSDDLSRNKLKTSSLEEDSIVFRTEDLSKNKPQSSDLEVDSNVFRADDLSKNKLNESSIEKDSAQFRTDDLSKNKSKTSDLEANSSKFRSDDLSKNKLKESDLETDSIPFRDSGLAANKPKVGSLEIDSKQFRVDELSANKPSLSDIEKDSSGFRSDDLSFNNPRVTDLESDSVVFRIDDLSFNVAKTTDLEIDSIPFRDDDLSFNRLKVTDLEIDSIPFRDDDLSFNIPNITNLETDSVQFRLDDLAANVLGTTDLITDSTPFLYNNLSSNVPGLSDLEIDSVPFRDDDLAANTPSTSDLLSDSTLFRNDDLAANIPSTSDLLADSTPFRALDLAANIPINSNIAYDSIQFRDDVLASNTPYNTNLLLDSKTFREDTVSKNAGYGLLGVNVQGAGTNAFLGISRVFTQGILVRKLLQSKNKSKKTNLFLDSKTFRDNNKVPNRWQISNDEYTSNSQNWKLGRITQGSYNTNLVDYSPIEPYYTPTAKAIFSTDDFIITKGKELQDLYGMSTRIDFPTGRRNREISDALFSVNTTIAKGGEFLDYFFKRQTYVPFNEGIVTSTIRNYNQERNAFNIHNLQSGDPSSLGDLQGFNQDGFQDLIQKTIGSFNGKFQSRTLTTPSNIIEKNNGAYYNGGASGTDILRPGAEDAVLGSAESMMSKTIPGNPFENEDFSTGKRGVKHIINTIKSSGKPMAANFDPQNNKAYIIGTNRDGTSRIAKQRYTIANPYAPGRAGKLLFSLKNYASGDQFYFPPYIQSIQNTENASWNSVNFLGRPEAMYTYNNSSRDASISFYVLTDYSQSVDIGRDWKSEDMPKVTTTFSNHFTDSDVSQNNSRQLKQEQLRKLKDDQQKELENLKQKEKQNSTGDALVSSDTGEITIKGGDGSHQVSSIKKSEKQKESAANKSASENSIEDAAFKAEVQRIRSEAAKTTEALGDEQTKMNRSTNYSESNTTSGNIYNLNITKKEFNGDEIICKPEDTIDRINTMKKGIMFQPAFFSGDKVDFVRKIEFLSKLTRPAASPVQPNTGFSFTKPPISHIKLGDWWDHDIVVNSVSYDYADAPWTLEGGKVQPMWVLVSINFNIIGPFGSANSRPPLATGNGGMYSPMY